MTQNIPAAGPEDFWRELQSSESNWFTDTGMQADEVYKKLYPSLRNHHQVISAIATFLDAQAIDTGWENWKKPIQRHELLRRFQVITSMNQLPEKLVPFLKFYFRSSDPALYQSAAPAIGHHLSSSEELQKYIQSYCKDRAIDTDQPAKLNGDRSRRRIALVFAADHQRTSKLRFPEFPDGNINTSDLVVHLTALDLLCRRNPDKSSKAIISAAGYFIKELSERPFQANRLCGKKLSALAVTLHEFHHTDTTDLVIRFIIKWLEDFSKLQSTAKCMQVLDAIDEMCASLATNSSFDDAMLAAQLHGLDLEWVNCRIRNWQDRLSIKSLNITNKVWSSETDFPDFWPVVRNFHLQPGTDQTDSKLTSNRDSRYYLVLAHLFGFIDGAQWIKLSSSAQAMCAFLLLDYTKYAPAGLTRRLHQLFNTTGRKPVEAVYSVLIDRFDQHDVYAESGLIHSFEDEQLLFKLIRYGSVDTPIFELVDAIEHRFRLQLATDPGFDPGKYLYRITLYRPSQAFYSYFNEIIKSRTYVNLNGDSIDVNHLLSAFKSGKTEITAESGFAADLSKFRSRIATAELTRFAIIDSAGFLINLLQNSSSSDNQTFIQIFESFFAEAGIEPVMVEKLCNELATISENIKPEEFTKLDFIRNNMVDSIKVLTRINQVISQLLNPADHALFSSVIDRCMILFKSYESVLEKVSGALSKSGGKNRNLTPGDIDSIFDLVTPLPDGPVKSGLTDIITIQIISKIRNDQFEITTVANAGDKLNDDDPWIHEYLLIEKLSSELPGKITDAKNLTPILAQSWSHLTRRALDDGFENRVSQMIKPGPFEKIYSEPACADLLHEIRNWFLDRYSLIKAMRVNRIVSGQKSWSVKHQSMQLNSFVGHYSAVWIAIILGSILMLDFGDAWASMAEDDDLRGILITFSIAITATFAYTLAKLKNDVNHAPGESIWKNRFLWTGRTAMFLLMCLACAYLAAGGLWWILSGTDHVVHGQGAILHITVWASFSLFIGLFFGLIAKQD